jgi:alpha-L-fucosidase
MRCRFLTLGAALTAALLGISSALAQSAKYEANWESLDARPCPAWFSDAKFGIFIHWGVYSVPAWGPPRQYAEWYWLNVDKHKNNPKDAWWHFHERVYGPTFEYAEFAPMFKAELFDADAWADLLYRSGAKYVLPTSKHHDGFCLWPSAEADRDWGRPWNATTVGPKRDLLGELTEAVRKKEGMKIGFYYSLYEWFNPLWLKDHKLYATEHMHPQFKDVVTRYKPAIIFADGEWDMPSSGWKSPELLAWLFNESPCKDEVVVNDRWGRECRHKHGSYYTTEYGAGMKDAAHPWEENRGMGYSFGYNRAEGLDDYKSARELVLVLCDLVSRGGNLNLDIGPAADGTIPVVMQERLLAIGDWLKVNGEAIYGTRHAGRDCQWTAGQRPQQGYKEFKENYNLMDTVGQSPKGEKAVKQIFFTKKPEALYAITAGWPGKQLVVRNVKVPAGSVVTMLGHEGKLTYKIDGANLAIDVPALGAEELPCRYAYAFKIGGGELLPEE